VFLLQSDNGKGFCSCVPFTSPKLFYLPSFVPLQSPTHCVQTNICRWLSLATSALGWLVWQSVLERNGFCREMTLRLPFEMWFCYIWQKHHLIIMSLYKSVHIYCVVKHVNALKRCVHHTCPQVLHSQTLCCPCRMCSSVPHNSHNDMELFPPHSYLWWSRSVFTLQYELNLSI
jgi:hypothetical protein